MIKRNASKFFKEWVVCLACMSVLILPVITGCAVIELPHAILPESESTQDNQMNGKPGKSNESKLGYITTVVGGGKITYSENLLSIKLNEPRGISFDTKGNLYISDTVNHRILRVNDWQSIDEIIGEYSNAVDEEGNSVKITKVYGKIAVTKDGTLYYGDSENEKVSCAKFDSNNNQYTVKDIYKVSRPFDCIVGSEDTIYFTAFGNCISSRVFKIESDNKVVPFAGAEFTADFPDNDYGFDSKCKDAKFYIPTALSINPAGDLFLSQGWLYANKNKSPMICQLNLKIDEASNTAMADYCKRIVGGGKNQNSHYSGNPLGLELSIATGTAFDSKGKMYIADRDNNRILSYSDEKIETISGGYQVPKNNTGLNDGELARYGRLNQPDHIAIDSKDNLYISDSYNHRIRKITFR